MVAIACGAVEEEGEPPPDTGPSVSRQMELASLGYVDAVPIEEAYAGRIGVTHYDAERSAQGYNLLNSRTESGARLMAMDGKVVHRWQREAEGAARRRLRARLPEIELPFLEGWNHVELQPGGDLLVIGSHHLLMRLAPDSSIRWQADLAAHHDLDVAEDGRIHVLVDGLRTVRAGASTVTFQDGSIAILTADGREVERISLFDAFMGTPFEGDLLRRLAAARDHQMDTKARLTAEVEAGRPGSRALLALHEAAWRGGPNDDAGAANILFHNTPADVFHANSIQILTEDRPGLWRRGDWLVSVLRLDLFVIIDARTRKVTGGFGRGFLEAPHHATALPGGTILGFDNGVVRKYSRVVELDPQSGRIVWQYRGTPVQSFYSHARGGSQMLPNGNVLITESNRGHAFEVTRDGETVWAYYNEDLVEREGETRRGTLYRVTRLGSDAVAPLLGD